ncbi:cytochrome c maturation protein CcmE [Chloroflexi bacterium TSY]|nr:cytochrome c maturation protein CcmE [Chloroflexi bacterium TSY]
MNQVSNQTIPAHLSQEKVRSIQPKFIVGGLLLLGLVVLMAYATVTTGAYYRTVDEVVSNSETLIGQRVRVNGLVVAESEDWNAQEIVLRFSIHDENDADGLGYHLPIVFHGPRPDNFHRAASAIVEGELLADGTFQADELLLKCPSRYEETPEEIRVKATG